MRIAIVSCGRSWLCDLARELDRRGHEVAFYSLVPPSRTRRFGLPAHCNRWLGPSLLPFHALRRSLDATRFASASARLVTLLLDAVAARKVDRCDLFIGMSKWSLASIRSVQRRFGAKAILERGSRHIVSQRAILDSIPVARAARVPEWAVQRELQEYVIADRIVVPSLHAARSFLDHGIPAGKVFRNPYGVDLQMFPATPAPAPDVPPTIIMVGTWMLRKGCDVLTQAWRRLSTPGTRLLHVGHLHDAAVPTDARFSHQPLVEQHTLTHWYARAHVLALPSREEGLALVQAQALASGLHVVASEYTGAADLREYLPDPAAVRVTPANDSDALAAALDDQLGRSRRLVGVRDLLGSGRQHLTWEAYGKRYDAMLNDL